MKTISMKFITASAVALLLLAGFVSQAYATCSFTGKVFRAYANTAGSNNYSYFYITPLTGGIPTYVNYVYSASSDGRTNRLLTSASNTGQTVFVNATRTSCLTTGTYRYQGAVNYVWKYSTR